MKHLKKNQLENIIDSETLNTITDGDDLLLDEAEGRAIEEISGYLNTRYDVEAIFGGENLNPLIVMYISDIMLFHLHARIAPDNVPEIRSTRYDQAKEWLEKVADGFTSPLLPPIPKKESMPIRYGSSQKKQNHYY